MSAISQTQNADVLHHTQSVSYLATTGWYFLKWIGFGALACMLAPLAPIVLLMHFVAMIEPKASSTLDQVTVYKAA